MRRTFKGAFLIVVLVIALMLAPIGGSSQAQTRPTFSLASLPSAVLEAMGEPGRKSVSSLDDQTWYYGASWVRFVQGLVREYLNTGNLQVNLGSKSAKPFLVWLGCHRVTVIAALGHPHAGYGHQFKQWFYTPSAGPYNSYGNGSAMRVSPVGWAFDTLEETLAEAKRSAEATHNHLEGIKGTQSVATAIFLARQGRTQDDIRDVLEQRFGYDLHQTYEEIQPSYKFDSSCQGSVPEALICALTSTSFEDAVRRAVALGGDADTQAAIAGSVAEALYGGVPADIATEASARLIPQFTSILDAFQEKYRTPRA